MKANANYRISSSIPTNRVNIPLEKLKFKEKDQMPKPKAFGGSSERFENINIQRILKLKEKFRIIE